MPGHIGTDEHLRKQVFRQVSPPIQSTVIPAGHDGVFIPWRTPTRDAAPGAPSTIGAAHAQTHTIEKVVALMGDVAARIAALETRKAQRRQLAEQQQLALQPRPAQVQFEQPTHQPTQDHAPPCMCHALKIPVADFSRSEDNATQSRPSAQPSCDVRSGLATDARPKYFWRARALALLTLANPTGSHTLFRVAALAALPGAS